MQNTIKITSYQKWGTNEGKANGWIKVQALTEMIQFFISYFCDLVNKWFFPCIQLKYLEKEDTGSKKVTKHTCKLETTGYVLKIP